ncbi:MAG: DUF2892 domain-containing protein [Pararheinheimera sp.]|jgi:membrane-associated protease RseP (regulator of RpoE activity)|nr:DUF2892 domain-containing protein [Rheinheimera sp.]MCA1931133.1 DUF2892 domain-containing protein [Rheinheimera sp.]
MQKNLGRLDKIARLSLGSILLSLAAAGIIGVWGWLGLISLFTGIIGVCPLYSLLGISSCPVSKKSEQ